MHPALWTVTLLAALGCGAVGGVFLAFSTFVMDGLARLPEQRGIQAMQSINTSAVRPPLMTVLFGTGALCVVSVVHAWRTWGDGQAVLLLTGSALYLLGTLALTIGYHVPRNDRLAAVDPCTAEGARAWNQYVGAWTRGNHVRAGAALAAAASYTAALAV